MVNMLTLCSFGLMHLLVLQRFFFYPQVLQLAIYSHRQVHWSKNILYCMYNDIKRISKKTTTAMQEPYKVTPLRTTEEIVLF